ncbi:MAG: HNH endonuclease [Spirochaetes bacterium]|nr:MAG: HNH endonuclease [Spirochaetota bacterium]
MPSSPNYVRDYKQEHKTAVQRGDYANKLIRGKARRLMIKKGLVKKGQDVDHKKPLSKGGSGLSLSNLRATSVKSNRSYPRNSKGAIKGE